MQPGLAGAWNGEGALRAEVVGWSKGAMLRGGLDDSVLDTDLVDRSPSFGMYSSCPTGDACRGPRVVVLNRHGLLMLLGLLALDERDC